MIEQPSEMEETFNTAESFEWLICQADYILTGNFLEFSSIHGKRKKDELLLCTFEAKHLLKGHKRPLYYFSCQHIRPFEKEKEYLVLLRETQEGFYHNTDNGSQYFNLWPLYDYREIPLIIESEQDDWIIIAAFSIETHLPRKELSEYCEKILTQAELHQNAENVIEPEYLHVPANSPRAEVLFAGAEGRLRIPRFMVQG